VNPERIEEGRTIRTPNGLPVTRLGHSRGHLLVYTRSRIYYVRRGKMRLWKKR